MEPIQHNITSYGRERLIITPWLLDLAHLRPDTRDAFSSLRKKKCKILSPKTVKGNLHNSTNKLSKSSLYQKRHNILLYKIVKQ